MSTEKRILWIDDRINHASMWGYKERLEQNGFSVTPAETIDEAFSLMQDTSIDWAGIIVDIAIPPSRATRGKAARFGPGSTENGSRAGYVLLKAIGDDPDLAHLRGVPIIVFKQVSNIDTEPLTKHCMLKKIPILHKTGEKRIEDAVQEHFQGKKR